MDWAHQPGPPSKEGRTWCQRCGLRIYQNLGHLDPLQSSRDWAHESRWDGGAAWVFTCPGRATWPSRGRCSFRPAHDEEWPPCANDAVVRLRLAFPVAGVLQTMVAARGDSERLACAGHIVGVMLDAAGEQGARKPGSRFIAEPLSWE